MDKKKKVLSASRIKTLEDCSWKYWCNYHEKVPQTQNDGVCRGTVCHTIFELLLNKKHRKHFDSIMKQGFTAASKPVARLLKTLLMKSGCHNEENYEMCLDMVYVGLNSDFLGKGGTVDKPEIRFTIKNESPKYEIMGFIDKKIKYKDKIKIVDYKSSKAKFRGEELTSNVQAMMYTLAAKKIWPEFKRVIIQFLFLRFPRSPVQELEFTDEQMHGFEHYLEHVNKVINNFTEDNAKSKYAADSFKTKWFCGPSKSGCVCPHKKPYDYFVLLNKQGEIKKSSFDNKKS